MAIYQDINITVNQSLAQPDKKVFVYKGDRNIILNFKLVTPQYELTKDSNDILTNRYEVDYFILTILDSEGTGTYIEGDVIGDICQVNLSEFLINKLAVGGCDYQITLMDDNNDAIMTYPVCIKGINIRELMTVSNPIPPAEHYYLEVIGNPIVMNEEILCSECKSIVQSINGSVESEVVTLEDESTAYRILIHYNDSELIWCRGGRE